MFCNWFKNNETPQPALVVDVEGRNAAFLTDQFPKLPFETQSDRFQLLQPTIDLQETQLIYVVRNILWNCTDDDCIKIFQTFIPAMEQNPSTVLLVNEMMSPKLGTFEPHIEQAYRRRDVTVMTMHNAKQRTEEEWRALFGKASSDFEVSLTFEVPKRSSVDLRGEVRSEKSGFVA